MAGPARTNVIWVRSSVEIAVVVAAAATAASVGDDGAEKVGAVVEVEVAVAVGGNKYPGGNGAVCNDRCSAAKRLSVVVFVVVFMVGYNCD